MTNDMKSDEYRSHYCNVYRNLKSEPYRIMINTKCTVVNSSV